MFVLTGFRRALSCFADDFGVYFGLLLLLFMQAVGGALILYLLPYPVLFVGTLALAVSVPSWILYRRDEFLRKQPLPSISDKRQEQALNWFIREVKH